MKTIDKDEFEDLLRRMLNATPIKREYAPPVPKKPGRVRSVLRRDDMANGRTKLE